MYVTGKINIANLLSRLIKTDSSAPPPKSQPACMAFIRHVVLESTPALTTKLEVCRCVQFGDLSKCAGHMMNRAVADELCCVGNISLRVSCIVIPKCLRTHLIELAHEGHLGLVGTKQNISLKCGG